jgi:manganese/zinc/iron transport system permease protein
MRRGDGVLIAITAACAMLGCGLFFKELKLLCFDPDFAGSRGMPVGLFDALLMTLVVLVTIVGLQAVGLVLIVALLVIPAAAARFWTESMAKLAVIAAALGLAGGVLGAGASALFPRLPSGAMIVLVCSLLFAVSMFFGPSRGVLIRLARRRRLDFKIARQHLLRALFEILEPRSSRPQAPAGVARRDELMAERSWSAAQFQRQLRAAVRSGLVREVEGGVTLTERGYAEAARLVRQHRLWELYLIHYAEVATARVDRDADDIEHVLEAEIVARLERLLERESREAGVGARVPPSPHPLRVLGETR